MQTNIFEKPESQTRLRAIVEIVGGDLQIFPIADSDGDRVAILEALRFIGEEVKK